jgi:hypothetical protein
MSVSLPAVPSTLQATREALHQLAEQVLAPARTQATGNEIALEVRAGGFGTPHFPDGGWVAVVDGLLQVGRADGDPVLHEVTSLRAAGVAAGLQDAGTLPDDPLDVDPNAMHLLADVFAVADGALRTLREEATDGAAPSPIRLWPEHFDVAYEEGLEAREQRAGFGVSPGDEDHAEPYAYVTTWVPQPDGPLWNATAFPGAELLYAELRAADDPEAALLAFWRERRAAIQSR